MESPSTTWKNLSGREKCVVVLGGTLHCGKMLDRMGREGPAMVMWPIDQRMIRQLRAHSLDNQVEG